jgi:hypothetical protein
MREMPLLGGRVTPGVVHVGDTVRRPIGTNSIFKHALLDQLESVGFDGAPRFLGIDEEGREILSFIPGDVPSDLRPDYPDETLAAAARLIRRFHESTAEPVCHNDLSPCNFVFVDSEPAAIIDFDAAAPGARIRDVAYALFLWLNLGTDGPAVAEQLRRARMFLDAYGLDERDGLVEALCLVQREGVARVAPEAVGWWAAQLDWVETHRAELEAGLR